MEALLPVSHPWKERPRRLLQNHDTVIAQLQLLASVILSVGILLQLAYMFEGEVTQEYRHLAIIVALSMTAIYKWRGVYRRFNGWTEGCLRIARSWAFMVVMVAGALAIARANQDFSAKVIVGWAVLGYVSQAAVYVISHKLSALLKSYCTQPVRRALVVGSGPLALHVISSVNRNSWITDQVVGLIDDGDDRAGTEDLSPVPMLGAVDQLEAVVKGKNISRIYIAVPMSRTGTIEKIYSALADATIDIVWVPDIFSTKLINHSVRELNGLPLIMLSETPLASQTYAMLKGFMDKSVAVLMLLVLSPLMLVVAFLVWQSSPGPIIFRQNRHGWDGRVIEIWKFRSMKVHKERFVSQARREDSRVTRIGKFIRRTSIDELPQLFNVLQGTMSLVGPRPHAVDHNHLYAKKIPAYMMRHRIKPGITGLAQVSGYRGETETIEKMLRRVELDIEYINNWSIWMDILILIKTPFSLFSKNIY